VLQHEPSADCPIRPLTPTSTGSRLFTRDRLSELGTVIVPQLTAHPHVEPFGRLNGFTRQSSAPSPSTRSSGEAAPLGIITVEQQSVSPGTQAACGRGRPRPFSVRWHHRPVALGHRLGKTLEPRRRASSAEAQAERAGIVIRAKTVSAGFVVGAIGSSAVLVTLSSRTRSTSMSWALAADATMRPGTEPDRLSGAGCAVAGLRGAKKRGPRGVNVA
jgi:hypothetical protein